MTSLSSDYNQFANEKFFISKLLLDFFYPNKNIRVKKNIKTHHFNTNIFVTSLIESKIDDIADT